MYDFDTAEWQKGESPGGSGLADMVFLIVVWVAAAAGGWLLWH